MGTEKRMVEVERQLKSFKAELEEVNYRHRNTTSSMLVVILGLVVIIALFKL